MNKALFLDRDGVVNVEKNYVYRIEDFDFVDGIFDLCLKYQAEGYLIIIITNQAGIARKYYTEDQFHVLTSWMVKEFENKGVTISKVYFCPHHPLFGTDCDCRKPKPGMILEAQQTFDLDLAQCVLIGDKDSDLEAGRTAGITKLIKVEDNSLSAAL